MRNRILRFPSYVFLSITITHITHHQTQETPIFIITAFPIPNNMFFNFAPIMCPFSPFASVSVFLSHTEKKRTFPHPPSLYFHNFTHSLSLSIHLYLPILSFLYLHTTPLLLLPYSVFTSITIYSFSCFSHLTLTPISLRSQDHTFRKRPLFDFLYLMSKKIKGVILDPSTPYAVSTSEDDRATLKYRTLMQDYHDWQKVFSFSLIFCGF